MRIAAALVTLALAAASCSGGDDAGPDESTPTLVIGTAPATTTSTASAPAVVGGPLPEGDGFAYVVDPIELGDARSELMSAPDVGTIELVACRWVGPAQYEVELQWTADDPRATVALPVSASFANGDQALGGSAVVRVRGEGRIVVPIDLGWSLGRSDEQVWFGERRQLDREQSRDCLVRVGFEAGDVHLQADAVEIAAPEPDASADLDTVEGVVASMDLADGGHPLVALSYVLVAGDRPSIDKLLVVDGEDLDTVRVRLEGTCLSIRSTYGGEADAGFIVQQSRGCPVDFADTEGDPAWRAGVPAEHADAVRWLAFAGVEPFGPADAAFDAEAWLAAWSADNPEVPVLASFDWRDGLLAVVDRAAGGQGFFLERYADPVAATPVPHNGGGSGSVCEAYGWKRSLSAAGVGYFFVVAEQPGLSFRFEPELDLAFKPTADPGRSVGFADISEVVELVEVVDENGAEVPCVQDF